MRHLLEKRENRHLTLLEILYFKDSWMTISSLANELGCSERILKQDIADLKDLFQDEILFTSNQGIRLVFPSNLNLEVIYQATLKESLAFQLLEFLFFNEEKTIVELASELYTSKSTLIRTIQEINSTLEPYEFRVSTTKNCMIIGNEQKIRTFFIHYFSERYSFSDWPYKNIDEELFEKVILFLTKFNKVELNFSDFVRVKNWVAVAIVRTNHHHYLDIQQNKLSKMLPDFSKLHLLFGSLEEKLSISLKPEFLEQIFSSFLKEEFILTFDNLLSETKKNESFHKNMLLIIDVIDFLSKKLKISVPNREHLILDLFNMSYISAGKKDGVNYISFILFNQKKYFIHSIKNEYPEFIQLALKALKVYQKKSDFFFSEFGINELLYTITIHWDSLLIELQKKRKKVKLAIVSHYDLEHAKMIEDFLSIHFRDLIESSVYVKPRLTEKNLAKLNSDLVITTTSLQNMEASSIICIQNVPSKKDIHNIYQAITACLNAN
ncbi:BglG family transcription antiterminator [Jeotgalibaca ciconiae]|nr:helix-turn-helix domain-containing protein [Jeotgalibaca ciconiae]